MLTRFGEFDLVWGHMNEFRRQVNRLFDEYEHGRGWRLDRGWPRTNLYDNGESLQIRAEVPGLNEKDLDLRIQANVISISGQRKSKAPDGYSTHRMERSPMKFSRSFNLPVEVDSEKAIAALKDGILSVTLPKAAKALPKQISVKAN